MQELCVDLTGQVVTADSVPVPPSEARRYIRKVFPHGVPFQHLAWSFWTLAVLRYFPERLVGMTQGARKRLEYRLDIISCLTYPEETVVKDHGKTYREIVRSVLFPVR